MILALGLWISRSHGRLISTSKVASFSVLSRSPRSRLNYTPLGTLHPTCSFLCCETGLSVYQSLNAPAFDTCFRSCLPLVCDLRLPNTRIDYVNTLLMSSNVISLELLDCRSSEQRIRASRPAQNLRRGSNHTSARYLHSYALLFLGLGIGLTNTPPACTRK